VASDGSKADTGFVNVTVLEVGNQTPILSLIGPQVVTEGDTLEIVITAVDPDSSIPQLVTGPLPPNAAFEDSLNGHGLFTFMPDYTQSGIVTVLFMASDGVTVLFMASDGALTDSEYVEITIIEAGNQRPILDPIGPQSVDEGDSLLLTITSSDPDGTFPILTALNLPAGAGFADNGDGTGDLSYYPGYFDDS
jgi:hypothetical protein